MQAVFRLTPVKLLAWLYWLRWGGIALVLGAALAAALTPRVELDLLPLLAISAVLAVINGVIGLSLRGGRPATEVELLAHLFLDTLALTVVLLWAGGSASPFVSLYLVPIGIAAASLPRHHAWVIALLAAVAYTILLVSFLYPMRSGHGNFTIHVLGMWATFIICASLLVVFVTGMAATVRRRDRSLAAAREQMLRNEQVTALGALAAGAAHELGTPLSTMATIVSELRETRATDQELGDELAVLDQQITLCRHQITRLLSVAEPTLDAGVQLTDLDDWLKHTIAQWRLMRPEIQARLDIDTTLGSAMIHHKAPLIQSLNNLLNNAADASMSNDSHEVFITASRHHDRLEIVIDDNGRGIASADTARAGRLRFSTKQDGLGLGLILSHVSLERIGGEVNLARRAAGGTRTRISLSIKGMAIPT